MKTIEAWRAALREALREAMRARQAPAVAALRETLAALDNAEAVDAGAAPVPQDGPIAGAVAGLGAAEVARRALTAEEATAIVEGEIRERREAAAQYAALGRPGEAEVLAAQADALAALR